jgi:predicted naringenin-chalcone synthase
VQNRHAVAILSLGTAVPAYKANQIDVGRWMAQSFVKRPEIGRWLRAVFANSGVETRYSCIADYLQPVEEARFAPGHPLENAPSTAERMAIYERESIPLGVAAAQQALAELAATTGNTPSAVAASITHLVVVSCTGFFAPGLDLAIARQLALAPTVARTLIGFMGCAAAFNGLRTAAQIVHCQPAARVLVVCVELCSLHSQPTIDRENLVAASLFADGASACVVGEVQPDQGNVFLLDDFHTEVKPETSDQMVWQIGNHGFALRLSPQIPQHLAAVAPAALQHLFGKDEPQFWAIHPGGPAIVDRLVEVFELAPEQVTASRTVLRNYGNLSSATIFFVLDELRRALGENSSNRTSQSGVAMAFGPGLVIEMARLIYVPAQIQKIAWTINEQTVELLEPA